MIKNITATNLKGRNISIAPGTMNVIVGPNWGGKTTILTAIRIGLLGYDPALGKRAIDTFQLATGDEMAVRLETNKGVIGRTWKMKKGKVSSSSEVPDGLEIPSLMLDIGEWFSMTGQQRRDYLLGSVKIDMGELDERILNRIGGIKIDPPYKEHEEEREDIHEEVGFWIGERDQHKTPIADWFSHQIALVKERVANKKLVDEQQTALIETIAQERAVQTGGIPSDQTVQIEMLMGERDRAMRELGECARAEGESANRKALEQLLDEIPENIEKLLDQAKVELVVASASELQRKAELDKHNENLEFFRHWERELERDEEELKRLRYYATELDSKYSKETEPGRCCPTCGRKGTGRLKEILDAEYKSAKEELDQKIEKFAQLVRSKREKVTSYTDQVIDKEQAQKSYAEASEKRFKVLNLNENLSKDLARRRSIVERLSSAPPVPSDKSPDSIREKIAQLDSSIASARELQKQRGFRMERQAHEAMALNLRDGARRTKEVAEIALKILVDEQSKVVVDAFAPLVQKIRKFTDGLLPFELSHRDGDLGYIGPRQQWVSHETFSGAEKAITYAGLGVALASSTGVGVVLLDEVLISAENKGALTKKMNQLIEEKIVQQCFVCDTSSTGWPENVTFIRL